MSVDLLLVAVVGIVFFLNLPFGLWRSRTAKFSLAWFLAIHLPIPFVFLIRTAAGFSFAVIPLLLLAAVAGQLVGGKLVPLPLTARAESSTKGAAVQDK